MMRKPFDSKGFLKLTSPSMEEGAWRHHSSDNMKQDAFTTPSLNNFDKPKSFMDDVKESVVSEMIEDKKQQLGSPSWAWKAQENLNHTGEQPLIVQQYLSSNKREQEDGVLPAKQPPRNRFLSRSAGSYKSPRLYQLSITAHQFLTATEMPNESEKIVDHRHGRPTRTSLLRARRRIPSAPGVKATVEFKTDLHLQQNLVAKRENKHKTVDIPEELLPITDNGETVHQFLVGARYNRGHYRDAKCLTNLGLYVCRDDITNCFLRPSSSHYHTVPRTLASDVLYNGLSQSSSSIRSTPQIKAKTSPFGPRPKSARVISKTKQPWTSGKLQASTPRSSHTESGNSFDYPAGNQSKPGTKVQNIDGSCLESREQTAASSSLKDDDKDDDDGNCVLCQTGVIHGKGSTPAWSRTQRRNSNPARLWSGKKGQTLKRGTEDGGPEGKTDTAGEMREESTESKVSKEVKQMVLQQYHLRIFGTKVGVKTGIPSAPRSNFLYQNVRTMTTSPPASKSGENTNSSNNNNPKDRKSSQGALSEHERPSSQISVRITSSKTLSTDDDDDDDDDDGGDGKGNPDSCDNRDVTVLEEEEEDANKQMDVMEGISQANDQRQLVRGTTTPFIPEKGDQSINRTLPEGENIDDNKEFRLDDSNGDNHGDGEACLVVGENTGGERQEEGTRETLDNLSIDDDGRDGNIGGENEKLDCNEGKEEDDHNSIDGQIHSTNTEEKIGPK